MIVQYWLRIVFTVFCFPVYISQILHIQCQGLNGTVCRFHIDQLYEYANELRENLCYKYNPDVILLYYAYVRGYHLGDSLDYISNILKLILNFNLDFGKIMKWCNFLCIWTQIRLSRFSGTSLSVGENVCRYFKATFIRWAKCCICLNI